MSLPTMQSQTTIPRLVLACALLMVGATEQHSRRLAAQALQQGTCNACRLHEEIRALSLEAIKEQILNKLGLKQAPNMTGRALPRIPPISKLMDMYGMQADQPILEPGSVTHHEEIDEFAAKTESVFAFAQPRELFIYLFFLFFFFFVFLLFTATLQYIARFSILILNYSV